MKAYLVTKSGVGVEIEISPEALEDLKLQLERGDVVIEVES